MNEDEFREAVQRIRDHVAAVNADVKRLEAELVAAREKRDKAERMWDELRQLYWEKRDQLPSQRTERIIRRMDVNTHGMSVAVRKASGRATRKHPALKRLYEKNQTVSGLAKEIDEGRPRVSSWFAAGSDNRPIPRRHAEHLRDSYGIPLSAWLRIAD